MNLSALLEKHKFHDHVVTLILAGRSWDEAVSGKIIEITDEFIFLGDPDTNQATSCVRLSAIDCIQVENTTSLFAFGDLLDIDHHQLDFFIAKVIDYKDLVLALKNEPKLIEHCCKAMSAQWATRLREDLTDAKEVYYDKIYAAQRRIVKCIRKFNATGTPPPFKVNHRTINL